MDNKKKQGTFCATLLVVFLSVFPFLPFVVVDDVFLSLSLIIAIVDNVYDYASVSRFGWLRFLTPLASIASSAIIIWWLKSKISSERKWFVYHHVFLPASCFIFDSRILLGFLLFSFFFVMKLLLSFCVCMTLINPLDITQIGWKRNWVRSFFFELLFERRSGCYWSRSFVGQLFFFFSSSCDYLRWVGHDVVAVQHFCCSILGTE